MMASHIIIVKFYHHRNIVIVIVNVSVAVLKAKQQVLRFLTRISTVSLIGGGRAYN